MAGKMNGYAKVIIWALGVAATAGALFARSQMTAQVAQNNCVEIRGVRSELVHTQQDVAEMRGQLDAIDQTTRDTKNLLEAWILKRK